MPIIIIIILGSAALSEPWSPQAMSPATSLLGTHSQFLQTNFHHHYHHHHTRLGSPKWALVSSSNATSDLSPGHPPANFYKPISIIIIMIIIILGSAALSEHWSPQAMWPATSLLDTHSQFLQSNFHHHYDDHHTRLSSPLGAFVSARIFASDLYPGHPPTNFNNPVSFRLHLPWESILVSVGHVLDELHVLSETCFSRILVPVVSIFYFLLWPTNAQIFHKLSVILYHSN